MTRTKELIKNTIILFLGKIATQFLVFFLLPLYTSELNPTEYGLVDLITSYLALIVPVVILELDMGVFRFLIDARGDSREKNKVISTSFMITLISLMFIAGLYCLISFCFFDFKYGWSILFDAFSLGLLNFFLQVARGLGKSLLYSLTSIIICALTIIFNLLFILVFNFGAESVILSSAIAQLVGLLFLIISLKAYRNISVASFSKRKCREIVSYSLPLIPNSVSWWVVGVSDRTIISIMLSVATNGVYVAATKFPTIISGLFGVFNMSLTESAALHIQDHDKDLFFSKIANKCVSIFSCLCSGLIVVMSFAFFIFVRGEEYRDAYYQVPILILGAFFNCLAAFYGAIYIAKKNSKNIAITSIIAAIINIVINLIFVKFLGLYAASISTVVAYVAIVAYRHYDSKKYIKIKYEKNAILSGIIVLIMSFVVYYLENVIIKSLAIVVIAIVGFLINRNTIVPLVQWLFRRTNKKRNIIPNNKHKSTQNRY